MKQTMLSAQTGVEETEPWIAFRESGKDLYRATTADTTCISGSK